MAPKTFDVLVWGSTGFTGKLVCSYLKTTYPSLRWAIAGRSESKLHELKKELALPESVTTLTADLNDAASLDKIFKQTKVVLSTAGPFAKIGTEIVEACIRTSTHYCDITGETQWVKQTIEKYHEQAEAKSLKIVHCCGFDCIPADLGAMMIHEEMEKQGLIPSEIRMTACEMKGGFSGGTAASLVNMIASSTLSELKDLSNPYCLNPRDKSSKAIIQTTDKRQISKASDATMFGFDKIEKCWIMPYIMQGIDTRIVNRSIAMSGMKNANSIVYSERMKAPNLIAAVVTTLFMPLIGLSLYFSFTRHIVQLFLPKPGQGPSERSRETGFFKMRFWGKGRDATSNKDVIVRGGVTAMHGDPGYKQTAKMVAESAVCLAMDFNKLPKTSGILTPRVAMGRKLLERLQEKGMEFYVAAN